uniref:ubiquitinyl hydrolase 1 n=1 Tax=Sinocyclocheilus grahami TaxID=75366 RepID=A0A672NGA0_SINGR
SCFLTNTPELTFKYKDIAVKVRSNKAKIVYVVFHFLSIIFLLLLCTSTSCDGNCLLHAASQYLLGVQDTDLVLRKALYTVLKETDTSNFRMRFQTELLHSQEFTQTGLRYSTLNWEEEWVKIVEMASPVSSSNGLQFDSLEDIHIFVLSNILRRPIIVIADQVLRSMKSGSSFSPLNVGGIYLPLHWPPGECYKYPIVLGYDSQHFAPLITIKDSGPEIRAVPLINPGRGGFEDLRVHFLTEKEQQQKEKLLKDYLMLIEIPVIGLSYDPTQIITAARLDEGNLPEDMNLMEDYLQLVNHEYKRWQEDKDSLWAPQSQRPPPFSVSQLSLIEIRCATPRCTFYVSVDTQPHCHECFEKRQAGCKPEAISTTNQTSSSDPESRGRLERSILPSPRSAPPTAPSLSLYSETHAMKCKTPGCLFTLSVEHDGLCERCFTARQIRSAANGPERERERDTERCVMCRQEVFRIFNGLCPPCMQRTAVSERGDTQQQEPRTEASVWAMHRETERTGTAGHTWQTPAARQCKRSGCQFFGTAEKLGFCTICYLDYQTNHLATPAIVQPRHASEAGFQNCPRCRGQGCGSEGKAMLEGYCNKCFVKEQSARLNQAASRDSHSPPLCRRSGCKNLSPGCTDLCPDCLSRGQREGPKEPGGDVELVITSQMQFWSFVSCV